MEKDNKGKLKILHMGADPEFLSPFVYESFLVQIETVDNPFSVSQWIINNGLPDGLICENDLPGGDGFGFYDFWTDQFDREKRIPFILLEEDKTQESVLKASERKMEVYIKSTSAETLIERILVLRKNVFVPDYEMIPEMKAFSPYQLSWLKRTFDIITASICLLIVSPILLIFIIAIRLETKGNVFYPSKRVGAGFNVFDFYKLRSMYTRADKRLKELAHLNELNKEATAIQTEKANQTAPSLNRQGNGINPTSQGDSRITKVGYIMRHLNIDELPQLFNVIKGDISMVGNRPLPIYEAELLTTDDWNDRFHSPAGITGIWKVVSRRKLRSMSHEERNSLQNKYSEISKRPNSFWNDIWIIIQTIPVLFNKDNP